MNHLGRQQQLLLHLVSNSIHARNEVHAVESKPGWLLIAIRKYTVSVLPHLHVAIQHHGSIYGNCHGAINGRDLIPTPNGCLFAIVDDPVRAPTLSIRSLAEYHIIGIEILQDYSLYNMFRVSVRVWIWVLE